MVNIAATCDIDTDGPSTENDFARTQDLCRDDCICFPNFLVALTA